MFMTAGLLPAVPSALGPYVQKGLAVFIAAHSQISLKVCLSTPHERVPKPVSCIAL